MSHLTFHILHVVASLLGYQVVKMPVRLTALVRKLPSISTAEFNAYWSEAHAPKFMGLQVVQNKVIRYSQFHEESSVSSSLKEAGVSVANYDDGAQIWIETYEDLMSIFQDEAYLRVIFLTSTALLAY